VFDFKECMMDNFEAPGIEPRICFLEILFSYQCAS
jgi:hypothetical protein